MSATLRLCEFDHTRLSLNLNPSLVYRLFDLVAEDAEYTQQLEARVAELESAAPRVVMEPAA
jgi:hypothetical protein